MGVTEVLRLLVEADAKGAIGEVERLGSTSEREVSRSEKSLDRWGNRLTSVGAGAVAFGAVAFVGLKQAGDAASDLNEVASKSATVFGDAGDEVDKFAAGAADIGLSKRAALEAASGFGNLFDQLGFVNDESANMSIALTELSADFASFHNADITEVIEAQTAAFRGEYDSLQRFVPTINAAAVQQRAMADTGKENAEALTDAEKAAATYKLMIEGAGAATGDFDRTSGSAANKQRQMAANFENLKAGIGQGVLPAMTSLLGITNDVVGGLSDVNSVTDGTLGKVATFGAVGITAAGGLSMVVGQAIKMRDNLAILRDGLSTVRTALSGTAGGLLAVEVAGAAALFAIHQMGEAAHDAKIKELTEDFLATGDAATLFGEALGGNDIAMGEAADVLDRLIDSNLEAAERFVDAAEKAGMEEDAVASARDAIESKRAADSQAAVDQEANTEAVREGADAMGEQADATADAEDALKDYQDALNSMFDPLAQMDEAIASNQEAQGNLRGRQLEAIAAQDAYNEAVRKYGEDSKPAREAAVANMEAQTALTAAERDARSAVIDLDSAAANLRFEMEENGLTAEQARARFIGMATQMGYSRAEAERLASQFGFTTREAQRLGQQRPRPTVSANTRSAHERFAAVEHGLRALDGDTANVHVNLVLHDPSGIKMAALAGARERGGPVAGGRLYEVAEKGRAELLEMGGHTYLIPGSDGNVVPARDAELAAGGAGMRGGTTVIQHFHIAGSVLSERELMRVVNRANRKGRGLN